MCSNLLIFLLILANFWSNFYFIAASPFSSALIKNVPAAHSKPSFPSITSIFGQSAGVKTHQPRANLSVMKTHQMYFPSMSVNSNGRRDSAIMRGAARGNNPLSTGYEIFPKIHKKKHSKMVKAKANSAPDESDSEDSPIWEWNPPGFGIGGWQFPNQWLMKKKQPNSEERRHIENGNEEKGHGRYGKKLSKVENKKNLNEVKWKNNKMEGKDEENGRILAKNFNEEWIKRERAKEVARRSGPILEEFVQKMRSGVKAAKIAYLEHPEFSVEDSDHLHAIFDIYWFYGNLKLDKYSVNKHATDAAFARAILYLLNRNYVLCTEVGKLKNESVEGTGKTRIKVAENMLENYLYWPNFVKQVEWLNWHNLGGQNFVENLQKMAEIFENAFKFFEIDLLWDELERNQEILEDIEQTKNRLKSTKKFLRNLAKIVKATDELSEEKRGEVTPEMFKQLLESIGHCF